MAIDPIPALKQQLADEILASVDHINRTIAADVLEINQARMSDLRHGRVARFSVERLIRILATIDRRVTMQITNSGASRIAWFRVLRERHARRRNSLSG
jgi:predicted XRE-type DNA-binding protein